METKRETGKKRETGSAIMYLAAHILVIIGLIYRTKEDNYINMLRSKEAKLPIYAAVEEGSGINIIYKGAKYHMNIEYDSLSKKELNQLYDGLTIALEYFSERKTVNNDELHVAIEMQLRHYPWFQRKPNKQMKQSKGSAKSGRPFLRQKKLKNCLCFSFP